MANDRTPGTSASVNSENNLKLAYQDAYVRGCEQLAKLDPLGVAQNAQAVYDSRTGLFTLGYLGKDYTINHKDGAIDCISAPAANPVSVSVKVLLVHYLITATGAPISRNLISFKELPEGGAIYCSNFQKRAIDPIVKRFQKDFDAFYTAAQSIGGSRASMGHASVSIDVFPKVPVTYVIWQGDDEVPAAGTILFDASVAQYLPVEDVVVAASNGSYELIARAKMAKSS